MADSTREVEELRGHMAQIDGQILALLDKRAHAARSIFELRKDQPAVLPSIDRAAIRELASRSSGDMPTKSLQEIFRTIHAESLSLELPVRVSFVGHEGDAAHAAARDRFGHASSLRALETPLAAVDEVSQKAAEFAVLPFATDSESPVRETIDALISSELRVVEVLTPRASPSGGHDQARYAVVGTRPSGRTEKDLTFFVFGVDATPGSLLRALKVLTDRGIDLTRIQSYPVRTESRGFLFCAESVGHFTDRQIVMAFEEIRRVTRFFKLLGSYPG